MSDTPEKPETDYVSIVVTVFEGDVDEIRAFGSVERAKEVCEWFEEHEPWKDVHRANFHVPGDLEDMREDYRAWFHSQRGE